MSVSTAFFTSFAHDLHLGFAEAINADVLHFRDTYSGPGEGTPLGDAIAATRWPDYDVYVIEGSAPLYAAATRAAFDDVTVVYLGGDRGTYALIWRWKNSLGREVTIIRILNIGIFMKYQFKSVLVVFLISVVVTVLSLWQIPRIINP